MKKKTFKPRRRIKRPGQCFFCKAKIEPDYKEIENVKRIVSERGKIISREDSGVCQKHQKLASEAIKRARFLGLLPYIVRPI
jgi:small subunit ribosomal protein S18